MEIAKTMAGFSPARGRRPAQGDRQEEARPDGRDEGEFLAGRAASGTSRTRRKGPLVADGGRGRLLLQPLARRLLRADRLPDRLAAGQLPGRVHGGADLVGDVDQGQGARSSSTAATRWGSRCCRPTSTSPATTSSSRRATSASGSTRSRTSATRPSRRSSTARAEGGEFTSIYDFCERVDNRAVNKRAVECLVKCGALDSTGGTRKGMLDVLPTGARRRARRPRRTPASARARSSTSATRAAAPVEPARPAPADRLVGVRAARAARAREGDARHLPLDPPARGGPRRAAREGRLLDPDARPASRTGRG